MPHPNATVDGFLYAQDGLRISYHAWLLAPEQEQAIVIIVHGLGEHGGRYAPLAEALNRIGCSVYAPDHRGHGRSEGKRGHAERFEQFVQDLSGLTDVATMNRADRRCLLIGHSGGGLMALHYVLQHAERVAGLVLSSPLLGIAVPIPIAKLWLGRLLAKTFPRITLRSGVDPRIVSHDVELVNRYAADPLVHDRITPRLYEELESAMVRAMRDADRVRVPMLIVQAGDDRIVSVEATQRFFAVLGTHDKTLRIYEGWYHELFNEVHREQVYDEVAQWIVQRIA